ncbi:BatD family protein [Chitinispirillales bacterium ANBcel5]|uniref:BatD family protein n=1 Tax=Cellulosispirillum alkaliphilum TaxID=3039283 RepID=UPI002A55B2D9|nr:BatD family protein [Chitinispirillales bacterium ANBcel5]
MKYTVLMIITFSSILFTAFAEYSFTVTTERTNVSIGNQFDIVVTLKTDQNIRSIPVPDFPQVNGLRFLGTSQRRSQNITTEIIGGKRKHIPEYIFSFIYRVRATETGNIKVPPFKINIDDKTLRTDPLSLNISEEEIANPDIYVRLILNKSDLYVGEQAVLTLKVSQRSGSSIQVQRGFQSAVERIERVLADDFSITRHFTSQITSGNERINGELYNTYSLSYSIFPLNAGEYTINPLLFEYEEIRRTQRRRVDPFFNDFFGTDFFGGTQAVRQSTYSNSVKIKVKALPRPAPQGFTGSVGSFSISSSVDQNTIAAGEALTLNVFITGNTRPSGLSDPMSPQIENAEVFTPQRKVHVDTSGNGVSTRKTYQYLIIPRSEGTLNINPIQYTFFDPNAEAYNTIKTSSATVDVTPGNITSEPQARHLTQGEIRQLGSDIRYIKREINLRNKHPQPYRQPIWYILFPIPFLLIAGSLICKKHIKYRKENHVHIVRQRALKTALNSIEKLKKEAQKSQVSDFLTVITSIIEKYISNKFGFKATGRTLEELKKELLRREIQENTINELTILMEKIDEFRFGGKTLDEKTRNELLGKITIFLNTLEKNSKNEKSTVKFMPLFLLLIPFISIFAQEHTSVEQWFNTANDLYDQEKYDSAIVYYNKILDSGLKNSAVLYNLGNVYYRLNRPGMARVKYERAALLNPTDDDIHTNLNFIKTVLVDRTTTREEHFIVTVMNNLSTLFPLNTQITIVFILLLTLSILISLILFTSEEKKVLLITSVCILLIPFLLFSVSTVHRIHYLETTRYAIILDENVDAKNQPEGSTVLFTAHEGTKVELRREREHWSLVSLSEGLSGWIRNESLEEI